MKMHADIEKFRKKIERLARGIGAEAPEAEVVLQNSPPHRDYDYHRAAASILKQSIEPRVELAADMFEGASIEVNADVGYVHLSFLSLKLSSRFYLLFCLRPVPRADRVRLSAESCLRPFVLDYEPSGSIEIPLNSLNPKRVGAFIEDQILKFLKGYLKSHQEEVVESEVLRPCGAKGFA